MAADLTLLLREAREGDPAAAERLYAQLYAELRQLARHRVRDAGAMTLLNTTALVHESFLRVQAQGTPEFSDRKQFFAYAARAMRSVVVDLVRSRATQRRGGDVEHLPLDTQLAGQLRAEDEELLRVHEALDSLAALDPRQAQVVELRYFGGLTEAEVAAGLGVTERTVQRDWQKARLFLAMSLRA